MKLIKLIIKIFFILFLIFVLNFFRVKSINNLILKTEILMERFNEKKNRVIVVKEEGKIKKYTRNLDKYKLELFNENEKKPQKTFFYNKKTNEAFLLENGKVSKIEIKDEKKEEVEKVKDAKMEQKKVLAKGPDGALIEEKEEKGNEKSENKDTFIDKYNFPLDTKKFMNKYFVVWKKRKNNDIKIKNYLTGDYIIINGLSSYIEEINSDNKKIEYGEYGEINAGTIEFPKAK